MNQILCTLIAQFSRIKINQPIFKSKIKLIQNNKTKGTTTEVTHKLMWLSYFKNKTTSNLKIKTETYNYK